jgi:hypothetical protein
VGPCGNSFNLFPSRYFPRQTLHYQQFSYYLIKWVNLCNIIPKKKIDSVVILLEITRLLFRMRLSDKKWTDQINYFSLCSFSVSLFDIYQIHVILIPLKITESCFAEKDNIKFKHIKIDMITNHDY